MSRERSVPCQRLGCRHATFNDDGFCSTRCADSVRACSPITRLERRVDGSAPTGPSNFSEMVVAASDSDGDGMSARPQPRK